MTPKQCRQSMRSIIAGIRHDEKMLKYVTSNVEKRSITHRLNLAKASLRRVMMKKDAAIKKKL